MQKEKNKNVTENVTENLNNKEKFILKKICEKPNITQKEISEDININIRQISRILKKFKDKKIIKRIESDRKGYWKIIK